MSKSHLNEFLVKLDSFVEHNKTLEIEVNYIDKRLNCEKHGLVSFKDRIDDYIKRKWQANSLYDLDENLCKELKDNLSNFEKTVIANIEEKIQMDVQEKLN